MKILKYCEIVIFKNKDKFFWKQTQLTVRPDVEVVLAQTYTARGATFAMACNIWLFPSPGSPTINM